MGMHLGYLAATTTSAGLLDELSRHCGDFIPGPGWASSDDIDLRTDDDGWVLAIDDRPGCAYLVDSSYMLSDAPDMVVEMSRRLGTVVGVCAETVSGTFTLTAARDGDLVRFASVQYATLTEAMSIGEPLPTEAEHPIEHPDGDGLLAALAHFNLDVRGWPQSESLRSVRYTGDRFPDSGRIEELRSAHLREHMRPAGGSPPVVVTVREHPDR
jgi:hypothetical protein